MNSAASTDSNIIEFPNSNIRKIQTLDLTGWRWRADHLDAVVKTFEETGFLNIAAGTLLEIMYAIRDDILKEAL